jgi:streptogramin lyase
MTAQFDVTPESNSVFALSGLPLGQDTFSAASYSVTCQNAGGATPTYKSNSVLAAVSLTATASVTLTMNGTTGGATVGVQFPTLSNALTEYEFSGLSMPYSITTGPDGNLWFTEVQCFSLSASQPNGLCSPTGNSIGRIGRIAPTGEVTEFATPLVAGSPGGIAAGPDGNIWFTERTGNRIGRITTAGQITEFTIPTSNSFPIGIAAGPDGNLWFTERDGNKIGRITPAGEISEFLIPTPNSRPHGIVTGPDGNIWFTEPGGSAVASITTSGKIEEASLSNSGFASPYSIVTGADGNIWFTDSLSSVIGRIELVPSLGGPLHVTTAFAIPTPNSSPQGLAAGPDGNVWFTEVLSDLAGLIGQITLEGTIREFGGSGFGFANPRNIAAGPDGNLWFTEGVGKIGTLTVFSP